MILKIVLMFLILLEQNLYEKKGFSYANYILPRKYS